MAAFVQHIDKSILNNRSVFCLSFCLSLIFVFLYFGTSNRRTMLNKLCANMAAHNDKINDTDL